MTAFFWAVVTMSLTASVAILGVLLGRLLLKGAPKVFSYALWAVVLFRLLCPLSLPAEFSLLGLLPASPVSAEQVAPLTADPSPAVSPATPTPSPAAGGESPVPLPETAADPSDSAPSLLRSVLPALWLAGAVAMALYGLGQLHRLRRALVGALPLGDRLYWNDHIGTPFVLGLFRPRIYLPSTLSPQEAPYIIAHERHHIARGDHITRVLAFAALCLHWFNPLVWLAFVLSGRDMELSCDEAVMRQTRGDIRAEYSTSLLHFSTGRRLMPLAFGQGDVKERIENIMRYRKPSLGVIALAVVLCLALTACLSTDPAPAEDQTAGQTPAQVDALNASTTHPQLQTQLIDDLSARFNAAYFPYYEGVGYEISNYTDQLSGDQYTATFLWTMHYLNSGGDVAAEAGQDEETTFDIQATGTVADGKLTDLSVLADTSLTGPSQYVPIEQFFPDANATLTLTGYINAIDPENRTLDFDQVFWLTSPENDSLLEELGVNGNDLSNGYYIYNRLDSIYQYTISPQATQQIFEIPQNSAWELVDTDLATFAKELNTRTNLYMITVQGGVVTHLSERYVP